MAEKKKTSNNKKEVKKTNTKKINETKKKEDYAKVLDTKPVKKNGKFKTWFNNLTMEKILVYGIIIIIILLLVLIGVATKNTKTKNGSDIVIKLKGKTITADDLYKKLKETYGKDIAINLVDEYILNIL